jgi:hypothetical protein
MFLCYFVRKGVASERTAAWVSSVEARELTRSGRAASPNNRDNHIFRFVKECREVTVR